MQKKSTKKKYNLPLNPNQLLNLERNKKREILINNKSNDTSIKLKVFNSSELEKVQQKHKTITSGERVEQKFKVIDPLSKWLVSRNGRIFLGGVLVLALANGAYKALNERDRQK